MVILKTKSSFKRAAAAAIIKKGLDVFEN